MIYCVLITAFPWDECFPDLFWIAFWIGLFWIFRKYIVETLKALTGRLKHGAGIKIGSFEMDGLKVGAGGVLPNNHFIITPDSDGKRNAERQKIYDDLRQVMVVNKLFKSQKDGQIFDILLYVVPKRGYNLIQLIRVEYFFGKYWGNKIFTSQDRSNGFAIATSAYGPFLCTVRLHFNDGTSVDTYRYVDFEMGDSAPMAL